VSLSSTNMFIRSNEFRNVGRRMYASWYITPAKSITSFAVILVFRTWAIWGQRSRLPTCLLLFLGIIAIPTAVFVYRGLAPVKCAPTIFQPCCLIFHIMFTPVVRSPNSRLIPCWESAHPSSILFLDYIMVIVFESGPYSSRFQRFSLSDGVTVILAVTMYKGVQHCT
jgi:hypothetical protein